MYMAKALMLTKLAARFFLHGLQSSGAPLLPEKEKPVNNENVAAMKSYIFSLRGFLLSLLRTLLLASGAVGFAFLIIITRYPPISLVMIALAFIFIIIDFVLPIIRFRRTLHILHSIGQMEIAAADFVMADQRIDDSCRIGERYFFARDEAWILPLADVADITFRYDESSFSRLGLTLRMKNGREHTVLRCPRKHPSEEYQSLRQALTDAIARAGSQPDA